MKLIIIFTLLFVVEFCFAIQSVKTQMDLADVDHGDWSNAFKNAKEETVNLMAQPMAIPRPKTTLTSTIKVKSIHNDKWISFLLKWKDTEKSEAGIIGEFSDGVAIQFPIKSNSNPPSVFMGAKDNPVHIFHWKAQYQRDKIDGKKEMKDIYPNMNPDMYPMEFKDEGSLKGEITEEDREVYSHGKAAGNPQSYAKKGIDEIFAEGFGTSSVIKNVESFAKGTFTKDGWTVVISRPLVREEGSHLKIGENSFAGFAVWQGGKDEVGSRKCITISWIPLTIEP